MKFLTLVLKRITLQWRGFLRIAQRKIIVLGTYSRRAIVFLKEHPKQTMIGMVAILVCLLNYGVSIFLSNELVVRPIGSPQMRMSTFVDPQVSLEEQPVGCLQLIHPVQNLLGKTVNIAEGSTNNYCMFLSEVYASINFPGRVPVSIPPDRIVKINNNIVYTILPGYRDDHEGNIGDPILKREANYCTVLVEVGKPMLVTMNYWSSTLYSCGAAEGLTRVIIDKYMMKHV